MGTTQTSKTERTRWQVQGHNKPPDIEHLHFKSEDKESSASSDGESAGELMEDVADTTWKGLHPITTMTFPKSYTDQVAYKAFPDQCYTDKGLISFDHSNKLGLSGEEGVSVVVLWHGSRKLYYKPHSLYQWHCAPMPITELNIHKYPFLHHFGCEMIYVVIVE